MGWVVRYETNEVFDSALQETAERILPLAEAQIRAGIKDRAYVSSQHDEYLAYMVVSHHGGFLALMATHASAPQFKVLTFVI